MLASHPLGPIFHLSLFRVPSCALAIFVSILADHLHLVHSSNDIQAATPSHHPLGHLSQLHQHVSLSHCLCQLQLVLRRQPSSTSTIVHLPNLSRHRSALLNAVRQHYSPLCLLLLSTTVSALTIFVSNYSSYFVDSDLLSLGLCQGHSGPFCLLGVQLRHSGPGISKIGRSSLDNLALLKDSTRTVVSPM